jgi:5-formyltetrahydrofolate cyclo-ligase
MDDDEDRSGEAPCLAHRLIGGHPVDPRTVRDVAVFRRAERARLYEMRRRLTVAERRATEEVVAAALGTLVPAGEGPVISVYWPIRGELDLRGWMAAAAGKGARIALPVVVEKDRPLEFRLWTPGARMIRGLWNIPIPAEGVAATPDIVVAPLLGVDGAGYRLGNGGGYYDRTLALLSTREVIGVGHDFARMDTIYPMPWDVPMTVVVLSDGTVRRP